MEHPIVLTHVKSGISKLVKISPGLLLLVSLGLIATILSDLFGLDSLVVVIVMGIIISNLIDMPTYFEIGVKQHKLLLETAIVIMGVSVALNQIMSAGLRLFGLIVFSIMSIVLIIEFIAQTMFHLDSELKSLLAAGSGICGVSAVVAVAGAIRARESNIALAAGTILLFDGITLFMYPLIGTFLNLPEQVFGIWAGISMFSTGPVVAAGFAYSDVAGRWATVTKMSRNVFIGLLPILYSIYWAKKTQASTDNDNKIRYIWNSFPKFVIGFVAIMLLTNVGFFTPGQIMLLENAYEWLFVFAFAGLGLDIQFSEIKDAGLKPAIVILISLVVISITTLTIVYGLFG